MRPLDLTKKKKAMMSMNSDKNYKWDKMKYEIMKIKVEVNMMKAVIIVILIKVIMIINNSNL